MTLTLQPPEPTTAALLFGTCAALLRVRHALDSAAAREAEEEDAALALLGEGDAKPHAGEQGSGASAGEETASQSRPRAVSPLYFGDIRR